MKFVKYKVIQRKDGTFMAPDLTADPVKFQFNNIFAPTDMSTWHLGTLSDESSLFPYSNFQMAEVTLEEAVDIIKQSDPDGNISETGEVTTPNLMFLTPAEGD